MFANYKNAKNCQFLRKIINVHYDINFLWQNITAYWHNTLDKKNDDVMMRAK